MSNRGRRYTDAQIIAIPKEAAAARSRRMCRLLRIEAATLLFLMMGLPFSEGLTVRLAWAVPEGRAWAPVAQLSVGSFSYMPGGLLHVDSTGVPLLVVDAYQGTTVEDATCLSWSDSAWREEWRLGSCAISFLEVPSLGARNYVIWQGCDPGPLPVLFGRIGRNGLFEVDTVATHADGGAQYFGAVSRAGVRWATIRSLRPDPPYQALRLYRSESVGNWQDLGDIGQAYGSSAITIENDSTALIVRAESDGPYYGFADATGYREMGRLLNYGDDVVGPRFFPNRGGGSWMTFSPYGGPEMMVARYHDGQWFAPETLACAFPPANVSYVGYHAIAPQSATRPSVIWTGDDVAANSFVCACVADDSTSSIADHLWSGRFANQPSIVFDRNGDAWVYWWSWDGGGFWTHTFTTVAAGRPRTSGAKESRLLAWSLSSPAPGSWWAVLRSVNHGPFEQVARVEAGHGTELSWADLSSASGPMEYRVRRECVDGRFSWESEAVRWPDAGLSMGLSFQIGTPFSNGGTIRLLGAEAGALSVEVFDVQGREVAMVRWTADGTREDLIPLNLDARRHVGSGVYFLRARDATGRTSPVARLILLN